MNARVLLLTTFGLGLMKPAPGTWSSFPVAVLAAGLGSAGLGAAAMSAVLAALCAAASWVCVAFGEFAERRWGKKDPGAVTADEVAGQAITLLALPWQAQDEPGWLVWNAALGLTGFLAFRFFDIVKVPPAAQVQRMRGGWGILMDDLIAGVYALAVTQAVVRFVLVEFLPGGAVV